MAISKKERADPTIPRMKKVAEKVLPIRSLIENKDVSEAAQALADFRLHFVEEQFFQQATVTIKYRDSSNWRTPGRYYAVATRLETPKEVQERLERAAVRKAREAKRKAKIEQEEAERELKRTVNRLTHLKKEMANYEQKQKDLEKQLKIG